MFTGIIQRTGKVISITRSGGVSRLTAEAENFWKDVSIGDSIALDGVCLTVVRTDSKAATFDVSQETLNRSIMSNYKAGSMVNLEKALRPSDRLSGHFVQGHVDGVGKFRGQKVVNENVEMVFEIPREISRYVVEKGSIAINGISLTTASVEGNRVKVAIIPHTLKATSLSSLKPGDSVNIECDVIAKYVEKLLLSQKRTEIDKDYLSKKGFL